MAAVLEAELGADGDDTEPLADDAPDVALRVALVPLAAPTLPVEPALPVESERCVVVPELGVDDAVAPEPAAAVEAALRAGLVEALPP